jgi:hypothetical protein
LSNDFKTPSFSWESKSSNSSSGFFWYYQPTTEGSSTEVKDCWVVNENGDEYGQVISATLTLKGSWRYLNRENIVSQVDFVKAEGRPFSPFIEKDDQDTSKRIQCSLNVDERSDRIAYQR